MSRKWILILGLLFAFPGCDDSGTTVVPMREGAKDLTPEEMDAQMGQTKSVDEMMKEGNPGL